MICPKCGNRAEGNFCSHCGAALNPQVEKYMDDDFEFLTPEDFLKEEYINPVTEENLPESEIKLQLEPEIKPELKPELELKSEQEPAQQKEHLLYNFEAQKPQNNTNTRENTSKEKPVKKQKARPSKEETTKEKPSKSKDVYKRQAWEDLKSREVSLFLCLVMAVIGAVSAGLNFLTEVAGSAIFFPSDKIMYKIAALTPGAVLLVLSRVSRGCLLYTSHLAERPERSPGGYRTENPGRSPEKHSQLRETIRRQIVEELELRRQVEDDELGQLIDERIMEAGRGIYLTLRERMKMKTDLFNSFRRLDLLQALVDDRAVSYTHLLSR